MSVLQVSVYDRVLPNNRESLYNAVNTTKDRSLFALCNKRGRQKFMCFHIAMVNDSRRYFHLITLFHSGGCLTRSICTENVVS